MRMTRTSKAQLPPWDPNPLWAYLAWWDVLQDVTYDGYPITLGDAGPAGWVHRQVGERGARLQLDLCETAPDA
eukprot:scaffold140860_cov47-Prasinocladus_malaysianus.AAC.1